MEIIGIAILFYVGWLIAPFIIITVSAIVIGIVGVIGSIFKAIFRW